MKGKMMIMGLFLTAVLFSWLPSPVTAQAAYPIRQDAYVNDYADIILAEDEEALRKILTELQAQDGIEMSVITVTSYNDYNTNHSSIESFATGLFNDWGLGSTQRNDGVLFLVAVQDRQLRIELGEGYGNRYDSAMQRVIDNDIIPHFRDGQFGLGTLDGAEAIVAELTGSSQTTDVSVAPNRSTQPSNTAPTRVETPSSSSGILGWLAGIGALLAGGGSLGFWAFRPRKCPTCEAEMTLLGEVEEDEYLDEGEQAEERLGSVKHDVWECPSCQHREKRRSNAIFSAYKGCPDCHYRTVHVNSRVVTSPTYTSTGLRRITYSCRHCDYRDEKTAVIPRRQRENSSSSYSSSSSRSSRSSGDGRSSGGGASGSW